MGMIPPNAPISASSLIRKTHKYTIGAILLHRLTNEEVLIISFSEQYIEPAYHCRLKNYDIKIIYESELEETFSKVGI